MPRAEGFYGLFGGGQWENIEGGSQEGFGDAGAASPHLQSHLTTSKSPNERARPTTEADHVEAPHGDGGEEGLMVAMRGALKTASVERASKLRGREGKLLPLLQGYIDSILAFKKETWPASGDLDHLLPDESHKCEEMAPFYKGLDDDFEQFQAMVRHDVEKNGCYLIDESYFTNQARL
ncbi:hypothetical protein E2562_037690 [Oryza meyeriana var. granulata]|uniref:Uncharacterized protein n=1 Tax=Oryza meyeriana var. granulata TaxID=110450 RepID=A0A6G1ED64_9ORYZ|nr:hypothetical protein E2562_037690 [Oryza meyeriana var. granulata]